MTGPINNNRGEVRIFRPQVQLGTVKPPQGNSVNNSEKTFYETLAKSFEAISRPDSNPRSNSNLRPNLNPRLNSNQRNSDTFDSSEDNNVL